jgi:chromosome segregation ATPase
VTGERAGYPLVALEALRRRALDSARGELAAASADAGRAHARVANTSGALREAARVRREAEGRAAGQSALELDAQGRWLSRLRGAERLLRDEVERWEEVAARAAAEEDRRREQVADAERHLRSVERHRDRWERARRAAVQAAEEAEQGDLQPSGAFGSLEGARGRIGRAR